MDTECAVCLTSERDTFVVACPCTSPPCCAMCAAKLDACPLCRQARVVETNELDLVSQHFLDFRQEMRRINAGLHGVFDLNPGYGTISGGESMSYLRQITVPDVVVFVPAAPRIARRALRGLLRQELTVRRVTQAEPCVSESFARRLRLADAISEASRTRPAGSWLPFPFSRQDVDFVVVFVPGPAEGRDKNGGIRTGERC